MGSMESLSARATVQTASTALEKRLDDSSPEAFRYCLYMALSSLNVYNAETKQNVYT